MTSNPQPSVTMDDVRRVSPALATYTQATIVDDLWGRPGLSPRDRGIVTVAALIARDQVIGMTHYFNKALDSGVTPRELSEIVTHLAFYSGWSNAFSAVSVAKDIFDERNIGPDQLPPAAGFGKVRTWFPVISGHSEDRHEVWLGYRSADGCPSGRCQQQTGSNPQRG